MEDAVLIKKEIILSSAEIFSSVFSMGYDSHTNSSVSYYFSEILATSSSMVFCCS